MKKGDIVEIRNMMLGSNKIILEGRAKLIRKISNIGNGFERWTVKFIGDNYSVERNVEKQ